MGTPRDVLVIRLPYAVAEARRAQVDTLCERATEAFIDKVDLDLTEPPFCTITLRADVDVDDFVDEVENPVRALLEELGLREGATVHRSAEHDDWDDPGDDDGTTLHLHLPGDFNATRPGVLRRLKDQIGATGVAQVVGEISMGGLAVVLLLEVPHDLVADVDSVVMPKLVGVVDQLGLAGVVRLERPTR